MFAIVKTGGKQYRVAANDSPVHHDRTHPNQHIIMYCATMNNGSMSDAHIVSDAGWIFFVGTVDDRIVLDVDPVSDADAIYIATNNSIEPDAAMVTHAHIANNGGIGCNEYIFTKRRRNTFYRENDRHIFS